MENKITLSNANAHIRNGNIEKAIEIYEQLHKNNPLDLYIKNIEYAKRQLNNLNKFKPPRILYITSGLQGPSLGGGIGTCFRSMIEISSQHGYEADVLYLADPYYGRENKKYWVEYFANKNIGFHTPASINVYGTLEMKRSYQALEFAKKHQHKYTAIIYHDYQGIGYYLAAARSYGNDLHIPVIAWCHGNTRLSMHYGNKSTNDHTDTAILYMESKSVELADAAITPSLFYKNWWEKITHRNDIQVLKNYIHFETTKKEPCKNSNQQQVVAFYGRFEILKGLQVFIDAIKTIYESSDKSTKIKYLFAGNPTTINGKKSEDYIKDQLTGLNVNYEIILNPQPIEFFNMMNAIGGYCVFPTLGETSSCVIIESIHNGVAFIASDIEPIQELVMQSDHGNVLFKTGCHESLANKILSFNQFFSIGRLTDDMFAVKNQWGDFFSNLFSQNRKNKFPATINITTAIIIPTSDRPELLEETLISIQAQSIQADQIIVVDDNSVEHIKNKEIVEKYNFQYIFSPQKIYKGAAINLAAKYVNSEILIFFDDDDIANTDMVQTCKEFFITHTDHQLLSWFTDVFDHKNGSGNIEYTSLALGDDLTTNIQSNFFGKGSFAIRLNAFKIINGYDVDEGPIPMVDYRFYLKSQLNKLKLACIPKSLYKYRKNSPKSLYYTHAGSNDNMYLSKKKVSELIAKYSSNITKDLIDVLVHNHFQPRYKPTTAFIPKKTSQYSKWLEKSENHANITISEATGESPIIDINIFSSNGDQIIQLIQINNKPELLIYLKHEDTWTTPTLLRHNEKNLKKIIIEINHKLLTIKASTEKVNITPPKFKQFHIRKITSTNKLEIL